jgi:hypothetical protein
MKGVRSSAIPYWAITLGLGVLFAALIAMVLVPALYMMVEDGRGLFLSDPQSQSGGEMRASTLR